MSTPPADSVVPPPASPTVRKVATAPLARDRLRREAAALRRAAHPNVVQLASFYDGTDRTELQVAHAGDHTLVTTSPPDGPAAVACAASLAATIADLHGLGVVHGRLTPDHVVIAPGGRAVLCGLSETGNGDPTRDIRALGTLLEVLAAGVPVPGGRRDRRAVATLLAAADRARNAEPVPAAAELARLLGAHPVSPPKVTTSAAALPAAAVARTAPGGRRPTQLAIVVASALAALGTGAWLFQSVTAPDDAAGAPWAPTVPPSTVSTAQPVSAAPPTEPTTASKPNDAPVRFDAGGATFEVGEPGDVVVTGDWDCDGRTGAALLRSRTGEVFVFDVLPPPGEPLPGRALAPEPGAVALETIEQPGGCDLLVTRRADGGSDVLAVALR